MAGSLCLLRGLTRYLAEVHLRDMKINVSTPAHASRTQADMLIWGCPEDSDQATLPAHLSSNEGRKGGSTGVFFRGWSVGFFFWGGGVNRSLREMNVSIQAARYLMSAFTPKNTCPSRNQRMAESNQRFNQLVVEPLAAWCDPDARRWKAGRDKGRGCGGGRGRRRDSPCGRRSCRGSSRSQC